jgi:hypothetical protein
MSLAILVPTQTLAEKSEFVVFTGLQCVGIERASYEVLLQQQCINTTVAGAAI